MAREIEVGGQLYTVAQLFDPMKQANILRRVAGIFGGGLSPEGIMNGLSALPDDQFNYVVLSLLSNTKRKDSVSGIWTPVLAGGRFMFEDIDLSIMLILAYESGMENYSFLGNVQSPIYQFMGKMGLSTTSK